jgi:hypothetical protein
MKKIIIVFFLLGAFTKVFCDNDDFQKPDYDQIKKIIQDKDSEYYYPSLYERYSKSDTTLNLQDFKALYYGFLFNDTYSVYGSSDYDDSIRTIFSHDTLFSNDYYNLIKYENLILEEYPFNLRDLNTLANCYFHLGDTLSTIQTDFKLQMIVNAILSTGDGKSEKNGWHVISVSHEYDILEYFGFQFGGSQSLTNGGCDYLTVKENDYNIQGFYFDVNMILVKEQELFKK